MKYMGSKERICKYIVPIIQQYIDETGATNYEEPFCGGCSIIEKIKCQNRWAFDNNKYLIGLLNHVTAGLPLPNEIPKSVYDDVREHYYLDDGKYSDAYIGIVGFLASYNGRFFDGGYAKTGIEHTPKGDRIRNYYQEAKCNIESQAENLKGILFATRDFFLDFNEQYIDLYSGFVFLFDPPYKDVKQYANSKDFDYEEYYEICRKLSVNNIVLCCEQNMPEDFMCIWERPILRSIKATDKSYSPERLYTLGLGLKYGIGGNNV